MTDAETSKNIGIIVLAAGASRRMGQPKQLLPWGTKTVLAHAITQVLGAGAITSCVVLGSDHQQIAKSIAPTGVPTVFNPNWEQGMGTSIAAGLQWLLDQHPELDGVLVQLCDMPLVVTSHLKALIQALNNPTDILITAYTDTQGVPAIFGKAHFNSILELRDETGAKSIIQTHKEQVGKVAFPGPYRDIDTLEAYESIKKEVWS